MQSCAPYKTGIQGNEYDFYMLHALVSSLARMGRKALRALGTEPPLRWEHLPDQLRYMQMIAEAKGAGQREIV